VQTAAALIWDNETPVDPATLVPFENEEDEFQLCGFYISEITRPRFGMKKCSNANGYTLCHTV